MLPASLILMPLAPVLAERSAPARSTTEILTVKSGKEMHNQLFIQYFSLRGTRHV